MTNEMLGEQSSKQDPFQPGSLVKALEKRWAEPWKPTTPEEVEEFWELDEILTEAEKKIAEGTPVVDGHENTLRKVVGDFGTPGAIRQIGIIAKIVDPVSAGIMTGQVNVSKLHERDRRAVRSGDVD